MSAGIVDNDEQKAVAVIVDPVYVTPMVVAPTVTLAQPATSARAHPEPPDQHPPWRTVTPTDPAFVVTSELAALRRESVLSFAKSVVAQRAPLLRAMALVRGLPRLAVPLDDSTASRELTQLLRKRVGPFHYRSYAVAVLEVPTAPGAYRKGRSRQALRTNSTKARSDGTSCLTLRTQEEILHRFGQVIVDGWGLDRNSRKYRKWMTNVEGVPHASYFAAVTQDDDTLVFCKLIVAREHARLHTFIQNGDKAASNARFLLTEYMVESLGANGVRYLIVDTILGLPGGLRYLQQLMGYQPRNVTLAGERPARRFTRPGRRPWPRRGAGA